MECPGHSEIRNTFLQQVQSVWDKASLSDKWHDIDWLNYDVPKWKRVWGFQGYCPDLCLHGAAQSCAQETSKLAIKAAWDMWENRNKKALEWEDLVGIKERKTAMNRAQWKVTFYGPQRKRGRPRMDDADLNSDTYRIKRQLRETKMEFIKCMGMEAGTREFNFWRTMELRKQGNEKRRMKARQPHLPVDKLPVKRPVKSKRKLLKKSLRRVVNKIVPEAKCDVVGCDNPPHRAAPQCRRGSMRCHDPSHQYLACKGKATWCQCQVEGNTKKQAGLNSEDDIVVGETVIAFLSDDGWREGLVEWAQVVRTSTGHRQTAYHVCSEEEQVLYTIGFNDSPPLHDMEWWIVGHKQTADGTCEAEDHCQVEPGQSEQALGASATPPLSTSSEDDFPPFDPLTGSPVPPPPITPHYWLQYHNASAEANDNSSSTSDDNIEWLTVGTRYFDLEGVQLPSGEYEIGRPARCADAKTSEKTGKPKKKKPQLPIASIRAMIKDNVSAQYRLDNPKRKRSRTRRRYDTYKVARTLQEAINLGSTLADMRTDIEKGYVITKQMTATTETDSGLALDKMIAEGEDLISQIQEFSEDIQASTKDDDDFECLAALDPEIDVSCGAVNEENTPRRNKTTQDDSMSRTVKRRSNRLRTQLSNQALEALCAMPVIVLLSSLDPTLGAASPSMAATKKRTRTKAEIELLCATERNKKQRTLEQHSFFKKPP